MKSGSSVFALVSVGWDVANDLATGRARTQDREKAEEAGLKTEIDRRPERNDMMVVIKKMDRTDV
jgi:hypothetical protein